MNQTFRSGASLHTLLTDAPATHLLQLLNSLEIPLDPIPNDDAKIREVLHASLNKMSQKQARQLNDLSLRLQTMSGPRGAETLDRVARSALPAAVFATFKAQPAPLARSIWACPEAPRLFEDAESFHHARQVRDFSPIFSAFDAPVARSFVWTAESEAQLRERIVRELNLDGPVRLSHLEVSDDGESEPSHVIIVRHGGPLSSVAAHGKDGGKDWLYFEPSTEATLVYSPARGIVEVCAASPSVRQDLAVSFAEVGLGEDLSSKPLSFKLYNLARFRSSLALPFFEPAGFRVQSVSVVDAEVSLFDHGQRVSLKVNSEDDIEAVADRAFGGRRLFQGWPIVRVVIAVQYWPEHGSKVRTLHINLSQPNRCNLRGQPDAYLRKLGYDLLEHWGVLHALRTLGPDDRRALLPALLELYNLGQDLLPEHELNERGFDIAGFSGHGFLEPAGRLTSILLDSDDGGPEVVEVRPGIGGTGEFEDATGGAAWHPKTLVTKYRVNHDWVRETILRELMPSLGGRPAETPVPELLLLGELMLGDEPVVCYLARGLWDFRVVRRIEDHLRGVSSRGYGLVLDAGKPGLGFVGANVVVPLPSCINGDIGEPALALEQLRLAFRQAKQRARNGTSVELVKDQNHSATLYVPGKEPLTLTGPKQIRIFDRLVAACYNATPLVPTTVLMEGLGSRTPSQAFSAEWSKVESIYLDSPKKGFWQLLT